jgi:hypothetical protein
MYNSLRKNREETWTLWRLTDEEFSRNGAKNYKLRIPEWRMMFKLWGVAVGLIWQLIFYFDQPQSGGNKHSGYLIKLRTMTTFFPVCQSVGLTSRASPSIQIGNERTAVRCGSTVMSNFAVKNHTDSLISKQLIFHRFNIKRTGAISFVLYVQIVLLIKKYWLCFK